MKFIYTLLPESLRKVEDDPNVWFAVVKLPK